MEQELPHSGSEYEYDPMEQKRRTFLLVFIHETTYNEEDGLKIKLPFEFQRKKKYQD